VVYDTREIKAMGEIDPRNSSEGYPVLAGSNSRKFLMVLEEDLASLR